MNFFEQELRKLADMCDGIDDPVFAGRACYTDIGGDNRAKIQFDAPGIHSHFNAVKVVILNRKDGVVDTCMFHFADVWGARQVSKPDFPGGVIPHIWVSDGQAKWYHYKPTPADFEQLAATIGDYLNVFTNHSIEQAQERVSSKSEKPDIASRLESGKAKAAEHKSARFDVNATSKKKEK